MYSFSHNPNNGFQGEYPTPVEALTAARQSFPEVPVWIAEVSDGTYADCLPSALIADMKEYAAEHHGMAAADSFDALEATDKAVLLTEIRTTIEEWEADLHESKLFDASMIRRSRRYNVGQVVVHGEW